MAEAENTAEVVVPPSAEVKIAAAPPAGDTCVTPTCSVVPAGFENDDDDEDVDLGDVAALGSC